MTDSDRSLSISRSEQRSHVTICVRCSGSKVSRTQRDGLSETDSSATIRQRVIKALARQHRRFASEKIFSNGAMTPRMIRAYYQIDSHSERMLENAMRRLGLSARAYDRILKVSRTIADLEGAGAINSNHVSEAVGY